MATVLQEKQKANLSVSFFNLVAWKSTFAFLKLQRFSKPLGYFGGSAFRLPPG
jgi:hypothetical protein